MPEIPCVFMRGGTSRGPFLLSEDLPASPEQARPVLAHIMGWPRIAGDGIGGGHPQTSKIAIVGPSAKARRGHRLFFAQAGVRDGRIDTSPNCGNMLAGVGPSRSRPGGRGQRARTRIRIHNVKPAS